MNTLDEKKIIFDAKQRTLILKGHGHEAHFLGFLQKLVTQRSLTQPFELFRFWLRIRGDICNRKTSRGVGDSPTQRVGESATLQLTESESESRLLNVEKKTRRDWESATPRTARNVELGTLGQFRSEAKRKLREWFFFNIEAKQTRSIVQKFISKRSEHVYIQSEAT